MAGKRIVDKLFETEIKKEKDVVLVAKPDRRLLSNVPDKDGGRANVDRRRVKGNDDRDDLARLMANQTMGKRYLVDYDVSIRYDLAGQPVKCSGQGTDISATGMLLAVSPSVARDLSKAAKIKLNFVIAPGTMPEGYEMKVAIGAKYIRGGEAPDGQAWCGVEFSVRKPEEKLVYADGGRDFPVFYHCRHSADAGRKRPLF